MTIEERFWSHVNKTETCWVWTGAANKPSGHSQFQQTPGKHVYVHRFAYELLVGPIPEGLCLDHLCKNPRCVNPAHLEPVTRGENSRRGDHYKLRSTHCPQGHPYSGDNLIIEGGKRPHRRCRTCRRAQDQAKYQRRAAAALNAKAVAA